jgi:LysM repeat protein
MRDEDTFVVGDEESDSEDEQIGGSKRRSSNPPPPYDTFPNVLPADELEFLTPGTSHATHEDQAGISNGSSIAQADIPTPTKYYVKPGDNLQGIALRFGVNGRELCRLNNLPPSTLTTTPHILHTRAFLTLPPSTHSKSKVLLNDTVDKDQEARLARERAEKRLQTLTKEVDWRVAKAYVALADIPDVDAEDMKGKETHKDERLNSLRSGDLRSKLEERAVARYLDDEEWEKSEGGRASIQGFPYFSDGKSSSRQGNSSRAFWTWKG